MTFLHGVETIEIDSGLTPIRQVRTAVIGLVGSAPMLDVAAGDRTLNTMKLITNKRDAVRYFGQDRSGFTIPQALDAIFDQGAGLCIVVNCLDTATDTTTVTDEAHTFGDDREITLAHSQVSAVTVTGAGGTPTYVANTDYTLDSTNGKLTLPATGSAITTSTSILVDYSYLDPTKVTNAEIIGTVDAGGNRTGMQAFLDAYPTFGYHIKTLIAPGFSGTRAVWTEMVTIAEKERAIAVADLPVSITFDNAIASRGVGGAVDFNTSSDRLVACYPHLKRLNISTNTEELVPFSPYWAGVMAKKDNDRGYWWSASNTEINGITGVERRLTASINDNTSEVNLLNEQGIVTTFKDFGTGIRTWGNRSTAWPTVTAPRNFINIRRVADILHESLEYSMLQFIDRPINNALIESITESCNAFIRTLIGRGALIDGECSYNPDLNPATELALGHITFSLSFMPPPPAERITFESLIDITFLNQLGRSLADA